MGSWPPPVEIAHLPELDGPEAGNGRTKTSSRPDSLDAYAIQRPFGEIAGCCSKNELRRKSSGLPGLGLSVSRMSSGSVHRSDPAPAFPSLKATRPPSGENEYGLSLPLLSNNTCGSADPSARIHWSEDRLLLSD